MNMDFKAIEGKVVEIKEDHQEILQNHDLQQLHDLSLLVQLGPHKAGTKLLNSFFKAVGHVHGARWVTTATNLLVLYMQQVMLIFPLQTSFLSGSNGSRCSEAKTQFFFCLARPKTVNFVNESCMASYFR